MDVSWPPSGDDSQVLEELRLLIEQGGAAHFLDAPIVRADAQDFPEPWQPTRACLERLLLRMFWLSYVDLDVTVDDLRSGAFDPNRILRRSVIDWVATKDGTAAFQVEQFGNDNVAGHLAHEVGLAFAAWVDTPTLYREAEQPLPTERRGSVAAVYLGLGVVASNGAYYHRVGSEIRGRETFTERELVVHGGLTPRQLIFLLAVQAVLRGPGRRADDEARELLEPAERRQDLRAAVAALAPHRQAIAAHLGLDLEAARPALEREPEPPTVSDAARPEPDRRKRYAGQSAARLERDRLAAGVAIGLGTGFVSALIAIWLFERGFFDLPEERRGMVQTIAFLVPMCFAVLRGWRTTVVSCGACASTLAPTRQTCPDCGVSLTTQEEVNRLRREEEERDAEELAAVQAEMEAEAAEVEAEAAARRRGKRG